MCGFLFQTRIDSLADQNVLFGCKGNGADTLRLQVACFWRWAVSVHINILIESQLFNVQSRLLNQLLMILLRVIAGSMLFRGKDRSVADVLVYFWLSFAHFAEWMEKNKIK